MIEFEDLLAPEVVQDLAYSLIKAKEALGEISNHPDEYANPELIEAYEYLFGDCQEFITAYKYHSKKLPKAAPFFED